MADYRTGNDANCHDGITSMVICKNYHTGNVWKYQVGIIGTVILPITILVIIVGVTGNNTYITSNDEDFTSNDDNFTNIDRLPYQNN